MAAKKPITKNPNTKLRQLNFLIGKWHTEGEIYKTASSPTMIMKGMDTYGWPPPFEELVQVAESKKISVHQRNQRLKVESREKILLWRGWLPPFEGSVQGA